MYSLKKRDPYNKYSIKHKTNMGQPHSNCRPRESMADSPAPSPQPPAPALPGGPRGPNTLCPCGLGRSVRPGRPVGGVLPEGRCGEEYGRYGREE